jgi:phage FluMu protein Com
MSEEIKCVYCNKTLTTENYVDRQIYDLIKLKEGIVFGVKNQTIKMCPACYYKHHFIGEEEEKKMRRREEILRKLEYLKSRVYCLKCNVLGELDYEGELKCPNCDEGPKGDWRDLGAYLALLYVLGEREFIFKKNEEERRNE